jgi:hypothetical protein
VSYYSAHREFLLKLPTSVTYSSRLLFRHQGGSYPSLVCNTDLPPVSLLNVYPDVFFVVG